jgi:hypothetical protein
MDELASTGSRGTHLFISYATEDEQFAEWLSFRLTAEGYGVWFSKFNLLGGESYPKDIDTAIKTRSYRLLALLSRNSISKSNCIKERTAALNIGKERGIDFLIPLKIDDLKISELDWMTSDITFIPFDKSWASGLNQLLRKLVSIETPKPMNNGRKIVAETSYENDVMKDISEVVITNCLHIQSLPSVMKCYRFDTLISPFAFEKLRKKWAFRRIGRGRAISFSDPSRVLIEDYSIRTEKTIRTEDVEKEINFPRTALINELLNRSIELRCLDKGLQFPEERHYPLFFPPDLLPENKLVYHNVDGSRTYILVSGERKINRILDGVPYTDSYPYFLAVRFGAHYSEDFGHFLHMNITVHTRRQDGTIPPSRIQTARTKNILKGWYNKEILNRQLAILEFLSEGKDEIIIGANASEKISISSKLLTLNSPLSINEDAISTVNEDLPNFEEEDEEEIEDPESRSEEESKP